MAREQRISKLATGRSVRRLRREVRIMGNRVCNVTSVYEESHGAEIELFDPVIEPESCGFPGCPLLGIVVGRGSEIVRRCMWHAGGKLNGFDTHARPGLTMAGLMRAYVCRRSIARHLFWMARMTEGFGVSVTSLLIQGRNQFDVIETIEGFVLRMKWVTRTGPSLRMHSLERVLPPSVGMGWIERCERMLEVMLVDARTQTTVEAR